MSSTNTLGKYQITREIARSNDIVYEAIDPNLSRRVALKELCLPQNLTGAQKRERIERFLREGKAAGQLAHPNIVTVYDVGQEGDRFYIAMELLEGQTLRNALQMRGALPVKEAVGIALKLCDALGYAHQHHVVHRDVKPENVQILPGGHVKLTDFGIARIMSEPSITADGQVFGTPSYMSPEQVSGKQIDGRSDIFSMGVLLYEMLAGQKPFSGDTVVTITYNIMNSEPAPPPGVPPYLIGIIRKAMAKDPNFRYQSIEEMAADLENETQNGANIYADPFSAPTPNTVTGYGIPPSTYGPPTGVYSPPAGSQAPPAQYAPDPFAQAPAPQQLTPPPLPIPRQPIMSAETRAFLGTFLLAIGLAGMLVLAVWATIQAYSAYDERMTTQTVANYIAQGDKLQAEGKIEAAMIQYANAKRAAGNSKAGSKARRRIAEAYTGIAEKAYEGRNFDIVAQQADLIIDADPTYSAGHFYKGIAYLHFGNQSYDAQFREAMKTGGNDDFARAARQSLCDIYIRRGDSLLAAGKPDQAREWYRRVLDEPDLYDPDWAQIAQDRINAIGG